MFHILDAATVTVVSITIEICDGPLLDVTE